MRIKVKKYCRYIRTARSIRSAAPRGARASWSLSGFIRGRMILVLSGRIKPLCLGSVGVRGCELVLSVSSRLLKFLDQVASLGGVLTFWRQAKIFLIFNLGARVLVQLEQNISRQQMCLGK